MTMDKQQAAREAFERWVKTADWDLRTPTERELLFAWWVWQAATASLMPVLVEARDALDASIGAHEHVLVEAEAQPPRMDELHADGTYISRPCGKVLLYRKRLDRIREALARLNTIIGEK